MPTEECIIAVYCRVDEILGDEPKHPQAKLYPSEVATLALLYALKGTGGRWHNAPSLAYHLQDRIIPHSRASTPLRASLPASASRAAALLGY